MTIRAHITDDRFGGNLRIWIADYDGDRPRRILRHTDHLHFPWEDLDPDSANVEIEPTITLRDDAARALADALVRQFQGTEDTRALRRDYDAERQRVDTQAQVIADVARTLAATRIGGQQ